MATSSTSSTGLEALPRLWGELHRAFDQRRATEAAYNADSTQLSPRRLDEAQIAGQRTYMAVAAFLAAAEDNQLVLERVVRDIGISSHAPWNLLRPAFEGAFHVLWILDPAEGFHRRRRGLQVELAGQRERKNWVEAMQSSGFTTPEIDSRLDKRNAEVLAVYGREAKEFGVRVGDINRLPNLVTEIPKLHSLAGFDSGIRQLLVATWRQLSGLQHGHSYALLAVSDKSHVIKVPGGVQVTLTANDDMFVAAAKAAGTLQMLALRRVIELSTPSASTV